MTPRICTLLAIVAASSLFLLPGAALAEDTPSAADQRKADKFKPTGTVSVKATSVVVGVGVSWGDGFLTFQNQDHPFKISGLSLVGVGGKPYKCMSGDVLECPKCGHQVVARFGEVTAQHDDGFAEAVESARAEGALEVV